MFTTNLHKFFNIDAPSEAVPSTPSIAQMMAQHGHKSENGFSVEMPSVNIEQPQPPTPTATPEPVATTNTEVPSSEVPTTTEVQPEPPKEQITEPTLQIAEPPVTVQSWQEVLKNQQPDAVLKELGYDEQVVSLAKEIEANPQMLAFYQHWKEKGDVTSYLRELSTDYLKMPAEEVMRHQLRQEYPKANERQLEILYNQKVVNQYKLNSDDEVEAEEGKLLLEAEADKYRDNLIGNQQKYLLPKPPEPSQVPQEVKPPEDTTNKDSEVYAALIDGHQYTKSIFTDKKISIGDGDEKFNFPVDPNALRGNLVSADTWAQKLFVEHTKPDGTKEYIPDVEKQMLISAVAEYGMKFINEIAQHFKSVGGKAALTPIENAKIPDGATPSAAEVQPTTVAGQMARYGRLV